MPYLEINTSSLDVLTSWRSGYNKCTNVLCVYQLTLLEYSELVEDQDLKDNYNPNILEWANVNYPRTFVYDNAQVNVLEEALPIQIDCKSRRIERERRDLERTNYDSKH